MSAEKPEHGTTMGLLIMIAAVVAFAAIVGASAVVAGKPAPREDFLAGLPEEKPRVPEAPAAAEEEDIPEEGPRAAELIARAEKLIADGSRDRGQIEGLLQGAIRERPGGDESLKAFRLLRRLYEEWRGEAAKGPPLAAGSEPPRPPVATPGGSDRVVLYSEDFERGPGRWSGEAVTDASAGGGVLRLKPVPEDKYSLLKGLIPTLDLRGGPDTRISFRYRTEGGLSRVEVQFWLEDASGKGNNHYALLSPSRNWTSTDHAFGRLTAKGEPIDLAQGFRIANMQVFAGRRDEQGACYVDDFVVYNPAGVPPPAAPPPPPRPVAPAAPPTPGFVSLIGTDLSSWGNPTGGTWKIEGGAILGDSMNVSGHLYTRKRFRDFTLKLKATGLATSGYSPHFKVRFRWVPEKGKYGCQTDLCTKAYFYAAIVGDDKPEEQVFDLPADLRPSMGASVEVELVAIGGSVTMLVNGRQVYSATAKITEPGLLGLCAHKSSILFERVEIKEH